MPALIRIAIALALVAGTAAAEPVRVVLADPDPELQTAVETTLAPWHAEIVMDPGAPATTADAEIRAQAKSARFVVWRRQGDLVVYDRERGAAEYRSGKEGALDEADATAAALTVKTLMRLPPPGGVIERGPILRFQLALAARLAGSDLGTRAIATATARPVRRIPLRLGLAGEAGTSVHVDSGGFKGSWRDWSVIGLASWAIERGAWELEPHLGAGVVRETLDGTEMGSSRSEAATLALVRGGVWVRRRFERWSAGAALSLDVVPGAPIYPKRQGNSNVFEAPSTAFGIGIFAAAELGR